MVSLASRSNFTVSPNQAMLPVNLPLSFLTTASVSSAWVSSRPRSAESIAVLTVSYFSLLMLLPCLPRGCLVSTFSSAIGSSFHDVAASVLLLVCARSCLPLLHVDALQKKPKAQGCLSDEGGNQDRGEELAGELGGQNQGKAIDQVAQARDLHQNPDCLGQIPRSDDQVPDDETFAAEKDQGQPEAM